MPKSSKKRLSRRRSRRSRRTAPRRRQSRSYRNAQKESMISFLQKLNDNLISEARNLAQVYSIGDSHLRRIEASVNKFIQIFGNRLDYVFDFTFADTALEEAFRFDAMKTNEEQLVEQVSVKRPVSEENKAAFIEHFQIYAESITQAMFASSSTEEEGFDYNFTLQQQNDFMSNLYAFLHIFGQKVFS